MLSLSCSSCAATLLVLWTSVWTIRLIAFVKAEKFLQKVTPNLWPRIHCVMQRNAVTWAHYFSSSFHPLPSVLRRKYRKWKGGRGMPLMIEWVVDDPSTWLGIVASRPSQILEIAALWRTVQALQLNSKPIWWWKNFIFDQVLWQFVQHMRRR